MSPEAAPKLLHVVNRLDPIGMTFGVLALAGQERQRGFHVALAARPGLLDAERRRRNIQFIPFTVNLEHPILFQWNTWHQDIASLKAFEADILHFHGTELDRSAIRIARALQKPYVLTFDGFRQRRPRVHISHRWCRKLIATSEALREDLVNLAGIDKERIEVVPPGLCLSDYERYSHKRKPGAAPVIGTLCRLLPTKGLEGFLRAAQLVLQSATNAQFVIVGEGPYRRSLWRLAETLGIARHVTLPGMAYDHRAALCSLDVFVAPLLEETSQFPVLEAMACARPVVATSVGSTYQIVKDGVTGRLVPRGDVDALANAITELIQDRALATRLGEQARRGVAENYDVARIAERILQACGLAMETVEQKTGARL